MDVNAKDCSLCPDFDKRKEASEVAQLRCHTFCWTCLDQYLKKNLNAKIKCPNDSCNKFIPDSIIRKTLSAEYIAKYENMCLANLQKSHRCLLPECNAIVFYSESNIQYACQVCSLYNCISCKASHAFTDCKTFKSFSKGNQESSCLHEINRAKEVLKGIERARKRNLLIVEDEQDLLLNDHAFLCWLCGGCIGKECGIKLRDCGHCLCRGCVTKQILTSITIPVKCPTRCTSTISDREIQSLLSPEDMKLYQNKQNMMMKRKMKNSFQCKYPDCDSIYVYEELPEKLTCLKCGHENCVSCGVVHDEETCEQYQMKTMGSLDSQFIEENIRKKRMMRCPDCQHLLLKTRGCNWIQCNRCLVELCWIRQMHRWGPKGRGDISGGCGCGVNKKFCHPDCRGCIPDTH